MLSSHFYYILHQYKTSLIIFFIDANMIPDHNIPIRQHGLNYQDHFRVS